MDLSIIIVNYNGRDFLQKCIGSVIEYLVPSHTEESLKFEIIIVDNASTDGSVGFIEENFLKGMGNFIKLIESKENFGFSKASNMGAGLAVGDFLLFLNPDTEFFQDGFDAIISFYKEKNNTLNIGAIGAKIINADGTIQFSCRSFPTLLRQFYESWFLSRAFAGSKVFGSYFMTYWNHDETRKVDWLSGAFLFLKKQVFFSVGCFNEKYFMYSEDTDICLKLARTGYCNYYFNNYTVRHLDAGIAGRDMALREAQIWKSRKIYFTENYSKAHGIVLSLFYFTYIINRLVISSVILAALYAFNPGSKSRNELRSRAAAHRKALIIYFRGV